MFFRHFTDDSRDQRSARLYQIIKLQRLIGHANKTTFEFTGYVFERWSQHFRHGPVMAKQIDDDSTAQVIIDSFMCQEFPHIEQIARMLAVKRGDYLAAEQVSKGHDIDFGIAKCFFHGG